jgi:hypothetical protein
MSNEKPKVVNTQPNAQAFANAEPKHRRGVKINNDSSTVPKPPPDTSAEFQERATKVFGKFEEYKNRGWELGRQFKALIEDTILASNKTIIAKDLEQEVMNKWVTLAQEMDNDNDQPQGIGGIVLCSLLMRMVLTQRDKINTLSYRLESAEKRIAALAAKVNETPIKE